MRLLAPLGLLGLLTLGCGSSGGSPGNSTTGGGEGTTGTVRFGVKAANGGKAASTHAAVGGLRDVRPEEFNNGAIASGPPEQFTIVVKELRLLGASGGAGVPIFSDSAGKELAITGSRVDLSAMFTTYECVDNAGAVAALAAGESCDCGFDAQNKPLGRVTDPTTGAAVCPYDLPGYAGGRGSGGKLATVAAEAGAYTALRVRLARKATISGCVTGKFDAPASTIPGLHTYCTQEGKGLYGLVGGGQNADFEGKAPTPTTIDLGGPSTGAQPDEALELDFPLGAGFTLNPDGKADLTLVIDSNRMLRFYNQAYPQSVNPGAPTDVSFFFTTVFSQSLFAFAGQAGSILGYELLTRACIHTEDAAVPADYACPDGGVVAAWMTVVTDPSGAPFLVSLMPDDDNTLTVLKGSNAGGGPSWAGSSSDPSLITPTADGRYDLGFRLGQDRGTVFNIDPRVPVGASLPDVHFRGLQKSYGQLTAHRRL